MRRPPSERLLPILCLIGAAMLIASEFTDTLEYRAGGAVLGASQGGGRHDYALLLLGAFAIVALAVAVLSGSRPAAIAVGVAGAIALLLFLLIDLPDAGATGLFGALVPGKAHPRGGYWLELIGAVVLLLGGAGLATVTGPVRTKLGEDPATMRGRA